MIAVFDVDRTLVPGSSLSRFGRHAVAAGLVPSRVVIRELGRELAFGRRGAGDRTVHATRHRLLALAAGRPHAPLAAVAEQVGRTLVGDVYPAARWLLDRHREAGDRCVLLSASPQDLVRALADALGVESAIGTRLEVDHAGLLTGRLDGALCYGPGKLHRLREELGDDLELARASAYSDSASDLPLLTASGRPVAVNPDTRLRRAAVHRGWPVIRFA